MAKGVAEWLLSEGRLLGDGVAIVEGLGRQLINGFYTGSLWNFRYLALHAGNPASEIGLFVSVLLLGLFEHFSDPGEGTVQFAPGPDGDECRVARGIYSIPPSP